jgi:hypothetical protein
MIGADAEFFRYLESTQPPPAASAPNATSDSRAK